MVVAKVCCRRQSPAENSSRHERQPSLGENTIEARYCFPNISYSGKKQSQVIEEEEEMLEEQYGGAEEGMGEEQDEEEEDILYETITLGDEGDVLETVQGDVEEAGTSGLCGIITVNKKEDLAKLTTKQIVSESTEDIFDTSLQVTEGESKMCWKV